jgi:hypothetical protein
VKNNIAAIRICATVLFALAAACGRGDDRAAAAQGARVSTKPSPPPPAPPPTAEDSARARAHVAALADSVRAAFARAKPLTAREVAELRQDKNAEQVATAQSLGIRAGGQAEIERLERAGRLVALGDSTEWWVLRDMDHSVPYVIPDAKAMLAELGRRFQARLARLGLPPYRLKVTSALRTADTQEDLRKINTYASRTVSSHEFGTTMDVSHERFAVPAHLRTAGTGAEEMEADSLEAIGKENAKAMQAELGRAILEMRSEGLLYVMMENLQPVYHMTVRRHLAAPAGH